MRTDVKVGLICCLILIAAVGLYFAFTPSQNKTTPADSGGAATPSQLTTDHPSGHADTPSAISVAPATAPSGESGSGATPILGPSSLSVAPAGGAAPLETIGPGSGTISGPPPLALAATEPATVPAGSLATGGPGSLIPPPPAPTGLTESHPTGASPSGSRGVVTIEGAAPPATLPSPSSGRPGRSGRRGSLLGNDTPTSPTPGSRGSGRSGTPSMPEPVIAPPTPAGAPGTYAVAKGDTLSALAKKNHVTLSALKAANPGIDYDHLKIKQVIKIPAAAATPAGTPATRPGRGAATRPGTARPAGTRVAATRPGAPLHTPAPGATYVVKKGDNLRAIAKAAYGDENMWRAIARTNRGELPHPNTLVPGTVLHLPAR